MEIYMKKMQLPTVLWWFTGYGLNVEQILEKITGSIWKWKFSTREIGVNKIKNDFQNEQQLFTKYETKDDGMIFSIIVKQVQEILCLNHDDT